MFDEQRFVEAYPAVRRMAAVAAGSDIDPDDLVQEALARTLAHGDLDRIDDLTAYLRRAVVNLAANERRHLGRRRRALRRLAADDQIGPGADQAMPSDLADLSRVRPKDRAALYLAVVEGRSYREVGEELGCSESAARSRVSRALRRLRIELDEEVPGADVG